MHFETALSYAGFALSFSILTSEFPPAFVKQNGRAGRITLRLVPTKKRRDSLRVNVSRLPSPV